MPTFAADDGTTIAYQVLGDGGEPVVCLPGGPMRAAAYLADLGGLPRHRQLIMLDLRGTGASARPPDPASYRCDRLVADVEALRRHLGSDRLDLLGHSAGTNLAAGYAARHPERVGRLALITPSLAAVGIDATPEMRRAVAGRRAGEPWYPAAAAALDRIVNGIAADGDSDAISPFWYRRWDAAAQAHHAADASQRNDEAAAAFRADGAFDPPATRAALARHPGPVLVLAGELDLNSPPPAVAAYAGLFPDAALVEQAGAGHFPWLDDAPRFVAAVAGFFG